MALICDASLESTLGATQYTVGCKAPHLANLGNNEIFTEQFYLWVIDSLERLAGPVSGQALLSALTDPCDANTTLMRASCTIGTIKPQYQVTPAQMQAIITWQLNQLICNA